MKYIIKVSPEIIIKSRFVRKKTINLLTKNIKVFLQKYDQAFDIFSLWDKIELELFDNIDEKQENEIIEILSNIPWIHSFKSIKEWDFLNLDDLFEKIKTRFLKDLEWKTFAVRVKRIWTHNFNSVEAERYLWALFLKNTKDLKVNLDNPKIKIEIEINNDKFYISLNKYNWLSWYPVWFQWKVLSLISWWFDSWVSTYLTMKRWCQVDFLFFNFWSEAHEAWVKQVSYFLWNKFWKNYPSKIIIVNFEKIIKELLTKIDHKYRAIILKRLMINGANYIAKNKYKALVKWDSLWQVSSQTLDNMSTINLISEMLILRPLITYDKQEIIDISKKIWTFNFASNMPEYCWVVSDKPATKSDENKILDEEKKLDEKIIKESFEDIKIENISEVLSEKLKNKNNIEIIYLPWKDDIIVDIREEEKIKSSPLKIQNTKIIKIPFYDINSKFIDLDQSKNYLFYCDKWVLSELHALYLKEKGFHNVKILRQKNFKCKN